MGEYRSVAVVLLPRDFDQGFDQSGLSSAEVNWCKQTEDTGMLFFLLLCACLWFCLFGFLFV